MIETDAVFSEDRVYRYRLWRRWAEGGDVVMFIGLNPSTADEIVNDPTVRRCINFAKAWGYSACWMANAFAYRSTDPYMIYRDDIDPVGPDNDRHLKAMSEISDKVVVAWGNPGAYRNRASEVLKMLGCPCYCFMVNRGGEPRHPLYLPKTATVVPYRGYPGECSKENPCCERLGEYNGFASGSLSFVCPKHCSCHD